MPEPERRLAFIDAGAEQFELEGGLQVAEIGRGRRTDAKARLPHTGERAAILPVLVLERR